LTLLPAVLFVMVCGNVLPKIVSGQSVSKPYIGIPIPSPNDPRVAIDDNTPNLGLTMHGARSPQLKSRVSILKRVVKLDSTGRNINATERFDQFNARIPTYLTRDDFIMTKRQKRMRDLWLRSTSSRLGERSRYSTRRGRGLRIDIPVEIKSKTFQKIFGGGTVGLDVTGDISIKGGFRHEKRSEVKTALNRGSDTNFKMEQTQRFNVGGHIGEKVNIKVDQNSEATFDFDNNIRLDYKGDEDEIVQSIEAGNISLSLPGTRFVTFGGKSSGLFGIKTALTLGRLKFTAVASQEKGEKKKLSLKGGATENAKRIEDYNYKKGTYFFLGEYYRQHYLDKDSDGNFLVDPNRFIQDIQVYKSAPNYQQRYSQSIRGWAWVPPKGSENELIMTEGDTTNVDQEHYRGYFLRLEKTDYFLEDQLGFIRLNVPLSEGEVLAVAYRDTSGIVRGQINFNPDSSDVIQLRLLRTQRPRPTDETWDLEWKNVYSLGGRNVPKDGFEVHIYYKPPSGDPQETITTKDGKKMTYLQLFGLDRFNQSGDPEPDNLIDDNPNILKLGAGELIFPDLRPFDPISEEYKNLLPADKRAPAIYDTTVQSAINKASNFYIEVKSKTKSSEYRLGMNVIENSEEVTLNGRKLAKDIDYTIDYFTGTLRLLSNEATAANANIDVTYESNQLFQIDKKTIMGARAEYALWDESFIGATFLYLNERTLDQKVRVGKGPMRNMVWDVNTAMTIKPFFLTRFANLLPFVDTRAPSTLKFEGEIAQILPNPNTRNNKNTNDKDGVAYIDDFEAAKRITPIGITRKGWNYSSPPVGKYNDQVMYPTLETRGTLKYWNPYEQVAIKQIWPNRDVNANVAQRTNVMTIEFTPADSVTLTDSWGGIEKALSSGYSNQTESKFLEIWVKGDSGTLHIDMGQISEDIIPNKRLDTEDRMENQIRNGILDDGEDIGLDGMAGKDPSDFWDINGNKVRDWGEPISYDDWSFNPQTGNYEHANGYEGNMNDAGGRRPDTEDMNGNGDVDLRNDYFEYSFSLSKDRPDTMWISGKSIMKEPPYTDYGWRQYRIPLNADAPWMKKIGHPDLSLIEYIRVWVDGFEGQGKHYIQIAEINLVGSEWKELGVATPEEPDKYEAGDDSTVTVTVVNTHDNPFYKAPPGVQGQVDRITQVIAKEQALVLKIQQLLPGNNGIIQKTFYEPQDYIHYNTMKMFVYGKDDFGTHITKDSSKVEFFLRFGSDENNYYEVREPVYEGWHGNNIEVDLVELSQIRFINEGVVYDDSLKTYTKYKGAGRYLIVKGKPALRNIRMLIGGVRNLGDTSFYGEVWMNELRLSNVKKDKGIAMRARLDFAWADLLRFNGEINKQDADFHNVATRFGNGDNKISGNFNTSVSLNKFLPAKLGLSIPVSFNYARSESTPKYMPGTDVAVTNALPDTTVQKIMTVNEKRGMSVSLSFNSRSQNFVMKHLLSKFRASYSKNEGNGSNSRTKYSHTSSESGNVNWGIAFGRDNYVRPFKWLGTSRLFIKLSDMKLYFTPSSFSTKISGTRNSNESETRSGVPSQNSAFNINRSIAGQYKVFESFSVDYNRSYVNDLRGVPQDTLLALLKQMKIGGLLTSVNQNFSIKYSPKLFSWLTNNISYSTGFKYGFNRQQRISARNATRNKTMNASGSFNLTNLVKSIYRPGGRSARGRRTPTRRQPPGKSKDGKGKAGKKKSGSSFSILGLFAKAFMIFEPFSVNYSKRDNMTVYGITGMPVSAFQFGFSDSLGVPLESQLQSGSGSSASTNRGSASTSETMSLSSGIALSRNIKLSLKYDENYSLNSSTTTTGQRGKSWLLYKDMSMPFANWHIRFSGAEKLPFLRNYMQRVSFDHTFSGRFNQTFNIEGGKETVTKEDKSAQFRPLVGMSMSLKNGITVNVKYNTSEKLILSKGFGVGANRTTSADLSFTATYSKRSDFRIPLPFLKNKRLKNNVDISVTFSMGNNTTEKSRGGGNFEVTAETSKWFFKPNVNYSFSDRVRGGAFFEVGKTHNKLIGDSSYKELGINVNISIRGN